MEEQKPPQNLSQEKKLIKLEELQNLSRSLGLGEVEVKESFSNLPMDKKQEAISKMYAVLSSPLEKESINALKYLVVDVGMTLELSDNYNDYLKSLVTDLGQVIEDEKNGLPPMPENPPKPEKIEPILEPAVTPEPLPAVVSTPEPTPETPPVPSVGEAPINTPPEQDQEKVVAETELKPETPKMQNLEPFDIGGQKFDRLQHVKVKRSSEEIEDDWFIVGIDGENVQLAKDIKLEDGKDKVPGKTVKAEDFLAWNNLGPEIDKLELTPTPESQPIAPTSEPAAVPQKEKASEPQAENVPEWQKGEELKELESLRLKYIKSELSSRKNNINIITQSTSAENAEAEKKEYEAKRQAIAEKIEESLRAEMGMGQLTPGQEAELKSKTNKIIFEELVKKENDEYDNALRANRGETLSDKALEGAKNILSSKAIAWYRKQHPAVRLSINVAIYSAIAGVGAYLGTGTAATVGMGAAYRLVRGASSFGGAYVGKEIGNLGVGFKKGNKWIMKPEEIDKLEKEETEKIKDSTDSLEEKSKQLKILNENLDWEKRKSNLYKAAWTIGLGAGAGVAAGGLFNSYYGTGAHVEQIKTSGGGTNDLPPEIQKQLDIQEQAAKAAASKVGLDAVAKSTETAAPIPHIENLDFVHNVKAGDSVWGMLHKTLNNNEHFKNFNGTGTSREIAEQIEAKQTRALQTFTDEILKNHDKYGVGPNGEIAVGQKVDFSKLFENNKLFNRAMGDADSLKPKQIASIIGNNRKIEAWIEANHGKKVNMDEILNTKPKVTEVVPESKPEIIKGLNELGKETLPPNPLDQIHTLNPEGEINDNGIIKGLGIEPSAHITNPKEFEFVDPSDSTNKIFVKIEVTGEHSGNVNARGFYVMEKPEEITKIIDYHAIKDIDKQNYIAGDAQYIILHQKALTQMEQSGFNNTAEADVLRVTIRDELERIHKAYDKIIKDQTSITPETVIPPEPPTPPPLPPEPPYPVFDMHKPDNLTAEVINPSTKTALAGISMAGVATLGAVRKPEAQAGAQVIQQQLEQEIDNAKRRLEVLGGNRPRTMAGDAYVNQINQNVEAALRDEIDRFYGKSGIFGLGRSAGINTEEWKFMSKLPANKVLEYYTHDATKSGLAVDVVERLSKSKAHDAFLRQTTSLINEADRLAKERGEAVVNLKPFDNGENMEQFVKRLGAFFLRNTPKAGGVK